MTKQYPVSGLKDVNAFLSAFPKNLQKGAVRSGLSAGARQVRDEARRRAKPNFANAIVSGSPRQNQDGTFSVRVYVDERKTDGFLGYFYEFGVSPHLIPKNGKRTKLKIGDRVIIGPVQHPGHAAEPFMLPALAMKAKQTIEAFADQVQEYLYSRTGLLTPYVDVGEAA